MAIKVRDRVPIRVLHSREGTDALGPQELRGCRFMGVLMHPVPWTEMQRRFGMSRPGSRIVVEWSDPASDHCAVQAGDLLQIGDETYAVCGVGEHPGCFFEVYVEEVRGTAR
jgi:hypothetical protein